MDICVQGLGLIGGSLCLALKRAGYRVYGANRTHSALKYALDNGVIDCTAQSFDKFDLVFVALPPEPTINFILNTRFKNGAIVCDICGVKKPIENAVYAARKDIKYVGLHPMAGKEVSGIQNACADLFDKASCIITRGIYTDERALSTVKSIVRDVGFACALECSAEVHDAKIAYTSQLAHVVSNCYVKDDEIVGCAGFTGGSFQDMTRIAGVDENVWASLYLLNKDNLSQNLSRLIGNLQDIKSALDGGDEEKLKALLRGGRETFSSEKDKVVPEKEIVITRFR